MKQVIVKLIIATIMIYSCNDYKKNKESIKPIAADITKEEALKLLHDWTNAYLSGNAIPLNELIDDSWIYSGSSNGKVSKKFEAIEEFANADYKFEDISYQDLDVRLYDNIAIVRGTEEMVIVGNSGKDTTKLKLRFTDVYQKTNGKVRAISTHSSPITND